MKSDWEELILGDVIKLEYGKPLPKNKRKADGLYSVYGANGEIDKTDEFYYGKKSIIVGRKGSAGEINLTGNKFWPLDVTYFVTFDEKKYDLMFLYFLLSKLNLPKLAKGVKPGINRNEVYSTIVKVPPLPEQRRIVAILDEAFAAIATAKANAEKNLQNSRELFETYLHNVFANPGEDWVEGKLGEVCILRSGTTLPKDMEMKKGDLPYLKVADLNISDNLVSIQTSTRFVNKEDINPNGIIPIGSTIFPKRGGAILTNKKRITAKEIWMDLNLMAVTPKKGILPEIIYYYFLGVDLGDINNGSSIPQINNYSIEPLKIAYLKSIIEQSKMVEKLEDLFAQTKNLETIYKHKLLKFEELKKSILQKAFNGELTEG